MRTLLGHRIFKPPFSLTVTVSRAGSGIKRSVRVEQRRFSGFILTPSPARGSARQGGLGVLAQPRAEPDRRRTLLPAAIDATAYDRVWPILLKNSLAVTCESSCRKIDLSERRRIDDRRSVKGSTTLKFELKSHFQEFFNRIGRKRKPTPMQPFNAGCLLAQRTVSLR